VRIATYNVNGINGRLANLLDWLRDTAPDIACLQELKAPDEKFPATAIRNAGYGAMLADGLRRRQEMACTTVAVDELKVR